MVTLKERRETRLSKKKMSPMSFYDENLINRVQNQHVSLIMRVVMVNYEVCQTLVETLVLVLLYIQWLRPLVVQLFHDQAFRICRVVGDF